MKTGFIIQARIGSTRLPNKTILPFYNNKCILELIIEKLKAFNLPIIIATTIQKADDIIVQITEGAKALVFRGDEFDVLKRFIYASKNYLISNIIRICADNPFIASEGIKTIIDEFTLNPSDYLSYKLENNLPAIRSHFGLWAEMTTLKALEQVASFTDESVYQEHVTNYIYSNPDKFNIRWLMAPEICFSRKDIRLTIDTIEDFENQKEIFFRINKENPNYSINDIIRFLDENSKYLLIMKNQIKLNSK
ncbi:MAG: glycosyl transferase family 2 [Bacteroidia bacterium]|nr:glycosyl transferase family 2 [Bacteroidia bacterium]